jgi:hypothetical protein
MSAGDDNVRVIVRVRPLNKREKEAVREFPCSKIIDSLFAIVFHSTQ